MMKLSVEDVLIAIGLAILPNIGGWLGAVVVKKNLPWLEHVKKPPLYPPTIVFAPVWTVLYCGMGYASFLVFKELRDSGDGFNNFAKIALALYGVQLVLNWLWTPIFFGLHSFVGAVIDMVVLLIVAAGCAIVFGQINMIAGLIFVPYILWLTFATYLSIALYLLN